ncbi:MAG: ABC transporter, permease protein 1 (cluster 4, leucine/isoleucine/valine/benzoate) [Enhydrobacter sp.]|nr:MAG: ABC transporter, permease protein 1 (cluster 4, leucine/isoleucine/valine/benzoate) [Enhydrobacter sp.]
MTALNSCSYWQRTRRRQIARHKGWKLVDFLQLTLNGLAVGCIYGLVALGFVLIYKATELVNFAQGDLLMLGAFVAYMAVAWWKLDYWVAFLISGLSVAVFGALLDAVVLRRVIGQPQFAVVMLTIGLGAIFRTFASVTWGSEIYTLPTPFGGVTTIGGVTLSHQYLSIVAGTFLLCGVLYLFFTHTRIGIAMQATSQNQLAAYYMGIPVKLIFSLIWAISAGVAAAAGILLSPVTLIDTNMGLAVALKAFAAAVLGGFGSIPGALVGGIIIGLIELYAGATLSEGLKNTAPYIVMLVVLAIRPQGLFGTLARKKV